VWLTPAFYQEAWTGASIQNQREENQVPGSALLHSLGQWFKQEATTELVERGREL